MVQELKARYCISAPLVMAGHEALKLGDTLRPPALKGALRFWWRALNWSRLRQQEGNDTAALQRLHREEADIFGSAAGQSGKQAKVLLRLHSLLDCEMFKAGSKLEPGLAYLLGQGMARAGLAGHVELRCVWRDDQLSASQIHGLQQAIMALGLFGSLGARARKGFGSLSLHGLSLNGTSLPVPQNVQELTLWTQALKQTCSIENEPPFTAWHHHTRCWVLPLKPASGSKAALSLLNEYGTQMMRYRLSDKTAIGGSDGRGLFKADAREVGKLLKSETPRPPLKRPVFGLPNNIYFKDTGQTVKVNPAGHERRASPLFAHLHEFQDGQRIMLATLLPARFLPENEGLMLNCQKVSRPLPFQPDWGVIERFIEQCDGKELTA